MAVASQSPKSQQRQHVMSAYRGRGHRNGNLWLLYSYKTKRDWIIGSDQRLVHWVTRLETDPAVKSFDLAPDELPFDARATAQFSRVERRNGVIEWHTVQGNKAEGLEPAQAATGILVFNHCDLKACAQAAVRWLKPISYVSTIRDQSLVQIHTALIAVVRDLQSGTLSDVLQVMSGFDPSSVIGVFVRFCISGWVSMELSSQRFNLLTTWRFVGECDNVDP